VTPEPNNNRSALITGASRGIGLQIARHLAARGMGLTITSRTQSDLDALAPALRDLGAPDVEALPDLVARHAAAFTDLSALIVNAGVGTAGDVADYPLRRLDKTLAVNLRAPFVLIQAAIPLLRAAAARHESLGAKIVVMSSVTGVYAERGLAAYGATKAATVSLVEALNAEESEHGVVATAIAPGYVDTDMSDWIKDRIPAESMIPTEDVALLVDSLLSLSRRTVIGRLVMTRAGTDGYRA
jgi:3-oxoacyl-[acyl-carrier protein] reductase